MAKGFHLIDAAREAALVARARERSGRDGAFAELFRALREPVFALCLHVAGNRVDAEDATQEVFLAVHRALPRFRGESRLTTWMYRIAIRAALRARARHRPSEPLDGDVAGTGGEAEMQRREEVRQLAAAMARLSAEHRAVLSLFALEGVSHREIAEILGIPEGTVWSRLHTARRRLAAELERGE